MTNDGATIVSMLEVEHPAAKILVELAQLQDQEVATRSVFAVMVADGCRSLLRLATAPQPS